MLEFTLVDTKQLMHDAAMDSLPLLLWWWSHFLIELHFHLNFRIFSNTVLVYLLLLVHSKVTHLQNHDVITFLKKHK